MSQPDRRKDPSGSYVSDGREIQSLIPLTRKSDLKIASPNAQK